MSFNYNQMHALMPSLLTNGTGFLQPMPGAALLPNGADNPELEHLRMNGGKEMKLPPSLQKQLDVEENKQQQQQQAGNGLPGQELIYNMPQNFMMMRHSAMMMDPGMFPLFGQLPPQMTAPPPQGPPQLQQQQQQQSQAQQSNQSQQPPPIQQQQPNGDSPPGIMKELISCSSCTLFPPNPTVPPPTTRERPSGCRTVFVGGLPENVTEDIIREVFDRCGEITTLRLSKKNFCHIRFAFEASVDSAIYLSGYRLRIGNQPDAANCGRLHVDYAQARDDQYEWECKQRQHQREQRHRERVERDRLRPQSPPLIQHYTDHEATAVSEKLKQDDTFAKAVQTLITWLERGDCSKKNSNTFYSMIQSTNSHVRRLAHEKQSCEEELRKAKDLYKKHMQSMVVQFNQIKKVFNAASHKKVSDHLSKPQRKNIEAWKRQVLEMRMEPQDDHEEDEMEMSDDERERSSSPMKNSYMIGGGGAAKRARLDNDSLKEENDSLKCQLQVYKNEVDLEKSDTDLKEQQIQVLQETIRNMQTQLLENKSKERDSGQRIKDLEEKLKSANVKELLLKTKIATNASTGLGKRSADTSLSNDGDVGGGAALTLDSNSETTTSETVAVVKLERVDEDEARIISLVSAFLVVHPFGASTDYVWSYVSRFVPMVRPKALEEILVRYSNLFVEDVTGVGAKIERKWRYAGFEVDE